jgi:hypothetical protein
MPGWLGGREMWGMVGEPCVVDKWLGQEMILLIPWNWNPAAGAGYCRTSVANCL